MHRHGPSLAVFLEAPSVGQGEHPRIRNEVILASTAVDDLYARLKLDIEAVAIPLFEMSEHLVRKLGDFLPHAAVLTEEGEFEFVGAAPDGDMVKTTADRVLPFLHESLRAMGHQRTLRAVGVAESVTIGIPGQAPTKAMKVLFEHQEGLTVALYVPYARKMLRGYQFGSMFSMAAEPEVKVWELP